MKAENKKSAYRVFLGVFFGCVLLILNMAAALVIIVDPFFHYHAPIESFPYVIDDQLTQNPGIAANTEYDSVSLGSSVSANFNVSWFKEYFGLDTAKLPYNGAYPKDIANAFELTKKSGHDLKAVFWAVDIMAYSADPEEIKYPLPEYLYDNNIFNDVFYIFNKDVLLNYVIKPVINPSSRTSWDEYHNTHQYFVYGKENVLKGFTKIEKTKRTEEPESVVSRFEINWEKNFKPIIEANPETTVYVYFAPRSILYWYSYRQTDGMDALLSEEKALIKHLLFYENVKVFYFQDDEETIYNLDNYTDTVHFGPEVSKKLLEKMANGEDLLTRDNYEEVIDAFGKTVEEYDYDSFF